MSRPNEQPIPTLASLFDGIGGFPLAAVMNGITPVWASEIEAFPMEVTKIRFPEMRHMGDITALKGANLPPVDIITGGSPCQDLSIASCNRAGLAGERSGLFMEQVRVTKELRDADRKRRRTARYVRPRWFCWENVMGCFSSGPNGAPGEDFRVVLEEICRIADSAVSIPRPPGGVWEHAGAILGEEFSLAWRVFDAQYWPGTPQRRKRVYLVADFGGHTAPKILFEQGRLFGDIAAGEGTRERVATAAGGGAEVTGGACLTPWDTQQTRIHTPDNVAPTLAGSDGGGGRNPGGLLFTATKQAAENAETPVLCLNDQGGQRMDLSQDISGTLRANMSSHQPLVLYERHSQDSRVKGPVHVAPTVSASYGEGGGNGPLVHETDSYCIAGNIIDRQAHNGGNHMGFQPDISYTLSTTDRHAVFCRQRVDVFAEKNVTATQSARQHKDATDLVLDTDASRPRLIRRLTPSECELLQGYPKFWTLIPGCSDTARYKALGNSVAIPCVAFVLRGIAYFWHQEYLPEPPP